MAVCNPQLVAVFGADRADGTGEQRLIRLMNLPVTVRLVGDRGIIADFFEAQRRQLATGVAIDAGRIHVEVTGNVGIEAFVSIGHSDTLP